MQDNIMHSSISFINDTCIIILNSLRPINKINNIHRSILAIINLILLIDLNSLYASKYKK